MSTCRRCSLWLGDDSDATLCEDCRTPSPVPVVREATREDVIRVRYHRTLPGADAGSVTHHADCWFSTAGVCTCGLLHDLEPIGDSAAIDGVYPGYWGEIMKHVESLERLQGLQGGQVQGEDDP